MINFKFTEKCPKTFRNKNSEMNGKPAYIPKVIVVSNDENNTEYSDVLKEYVKNKTNADDLVIHEIISIEDFLNRLYDINNATLNNVANGLDEDFIIHFVDVPIMPKGMSEGSDKCPRLELGMGDNQISVMWKCDALMINGNHISIIDGTRVCDMISSKSNAASRGDMLPQNIVNDLARNAIHAALKGHQTEKK